MIDVFVTVKDRYELAVRSLKSLNECTEPSSYRLTLMVDGDDDNAPSEWHEIIRWLPEYVLRSKTNEGLGPTINRALAHINSVNKWHEDPQTGDPTQVSDLIVYCQDDLLYTDGWLKTLSERFYKFESPMRLGFATGLECVEHRVKTVIPSATEPTLITKDWIRAAQMLARRSYWMSMWPIPQFDPETRNRRAKPNDGIGSGVDWWFIRNHQNSVCRTGRTNLVIPGLVKHLGYNQSTWLKRDLPESDSDKKAIELDVG